MYRIILVTLLLISGCELDSGYSGMGYGNEYRGARNTVQEQALDAIKTDNIDKLLDLLRRGGLSVYDRLSNGDSLLMTAIKHKAEKSAKLLVENGANVSDNDFENVIKDGNTNLFQWLMDRGTIYMSSYRLSDYMKTASKAGHWGIVKILLQKGAKLTSPDLENLSKHKVDVQITDALFIELVKKAVESAQANSVRMLFKLSNKLTRDQLDGLYPSFPQFTMEDALIELIQHGVKVTVFQCQQAFETRMHTLVQKMIETKAVDVNKNFLGKTMLYFAVEKKDAGLVDLLLEHGAKKSINEEYFGLSPIKVRILFLRGTQPTHDPILNSLCNAGAHTDKYGEYTCSGGWKKHNREDSYDRRKSEPPPPPPETGPSEKYCLEFYSEASGFRNAWRALNKETRLKALKSAYRALTLKYHGDTGGNTDKMKEVNLCRERLESSV